MNSTYTYIHTYTHTHTHTYIHDVNRELKDISTKLGIGDRVETMARRQAFISLQDHKENFLNNPKCRLINPAKNNLELISKQILDRINNSIRSKTNANQWRNTQSVIHWFSNIKDKDKHSFSVFDIVDFYPSISEALLKSSLEYAKQHTTISDEDVEIIMHSRKNPAVQRQRTVGQERGFPYV